MAKTLWTAEWRCYFRFYFSSYKGLCLSVTVSFVQSLLVLLIAYLIRYMLDITLPKGNLMGLLCMGAGVGLLYFANSVAALGGGYLILKYIRTGTQDLRIELLKKYYELSRSDYCKLDMGLVHARIVEDTAWLNTMTYALIAKLVPSIIICAALAILLVSLNWFLFLIIFSVTPLLMLTNSLVKKKLIVHRDHYRQADHNFSKGILFVLQMMDLTKIQTAETYEIKRQVKNIEQIGQTGTTFFWIQNVYHEFQRTIVSIAGILVLLIGGWAIFKETMTVGELISFYVVFGLLSKYLNAVWTSIPQIITGQRSLTALHTILETKSNFKYSGKKQLSFSGDISFNRVCFHYENKPVLQDINLVISPHSSTAIFGLNGAGKSTLAYLILGFYRPLTGHLCADGVPYDTLDIIHLRQRMSLVMQDPIIFHGTVWENITYGCPEPNLDDVVLAAELASAHTFIDEMPEGYQTLVGDKGILMSGGQRQRVALARAFLRKPRLLILDEPTNHLDVDAVSQFMGNLKAMDFRPTIFIISHDQKILREVDRVYYLNRGKILPKNDFMGFTDESINDNYRK
ncbi:ABC transporter ATP-binding protein [bacterium]|nr:ABC transporter ATP-binding protein [bacterium]